MPLEQISVLGSPFFSNIVLPFILIFTVVFAILQKIELFGKGKKEVDAIIGLVVGLLAVGVPAAIGVVNNLIPIISVVMIILFAWFLVLGFVHAQVGTDFSKALKNLFAIILGVILLGIVAWAVGLFDYITVDKTITAQVGQFTLFIGAIIAVISIVVASAEGHAGEKGK